MKKPNRLSLYADVRAILDEALASGGGTYECTSRGAAVHWQQRAYKFRKAYAEVYPDAHNPYDALMMPRIPADSTSVVITIRRSEGVFRPAQAPSHTPAMDDPLFDLADGLAKKVLK